MKKLTRANCSEQYLVVDIRDYEFMQRADDGVFLRDLPELYRPKALNTLTEAEREGYLFNPHFILYKIGAGGRLTLADRYKK